MKKLFFLIACLLFVFPMLANASPQTVTTCTSSNINAAMARATSRNDYIFLNCSTGSLTSQMSWNAPAGAAIYGNGVASTILTDNDSTNHALFNITLNGKFRMHDFKVTGGSGGLKDQSVFKFNGIGTITDFRVYNFRLNMQTYSSPTNGNSMQMFGCVRGVIDHSTFDLHGLGNGPKMSGGCGSSGYGDVEWNTATNPGTADAMYYEDVTFNFSDDAHASAGDCFNGCKQVYRFSTMHQGGIQTHPTKPGSRERGGRHTEVYNNTFSGNSGNPNFNAIFISSGTGYIINNTASTGNTHFLTLHSMRRLNPITYGFGSAPPTSFGACGTSYNGTGSNWDGNTSASTGYPCMDQPGRGVGDLLTGEFPKVTNKTRGCVSSSACANPRQALEPIYVACTTFTTAGRGSLVVPYEPDAEVENQDYYKDAGGVQTTATSPFNGSVGTGCGTAANRPTTNLVDGVGYWRTDGGGNWNTSNGSANDGCLDKVVSGAWLNCFYTPYTYPHPLITADAGGR